MTSLSVRNYHNVTSDAKYDGVLPTTPQSTQKGTVLIRNLIPDVISGAITVKKEVNTTTFP